MPLDDVPGEVGEIDAAEVRFGQIQQPIRVVPPPLDDRLSSPSHHLYVVRVHSRLQYFTKFF